MKRYCCIILFFLATSLIAADPLAKELERFEGNWEVVEFEASGMKVDSMSGAPEKASVKKGVIDFSIQGLVIPHFSGLQITIQDEQGKKLLNLVRNGKEILPCLYELTDTELKIAMPLVSLNKKPEDKIPRPESFDTKDKPIVVMKMKRP